MGELVGLDAQRLAAKRVAYFHGYEAWHRDFLAQRTAKQYAGFLLPYLHAGMSVLDCGCGPGSITLGLAEAVRPGTVVGVDIGPQHLEVARALASERSVTNVRFELADVARLPFPNATFEAVYGNTLLLHLRDPLPGLKEICRVLKPGGLLGVSDPDWATVLWEPSTPCWKSSLCWHGASSWNVAAHITPAVSAPSWCRPGLGEPPGCLHRVLRRARSDPLLGRGCPGSTPRARIHRAGYQPRLDRSREAGGDD